MMKRWLKPLFLFCSKEAAKTLISTGVAAALAAALWIFGCQKKSESSGQPQGLGESVIGAVLPPSARTEPVAQVAAVNASGQGIVAGSGADGEMAQATSAAVPTYSVILFVPTRYRNARVFVDGAPALVTEVYSSMIKLRVPRKAGATHFSIHSDLLTSPRELDRVIDAENYELSPFQ